MANVETSKELTVDIEVGKLYELLLTSIEKAAQTEPKPSFADTVKEYWGFFAPLWKARFIALLEQKIKSQTDWMVNWRIQDDEVVQRYEKAWEDFIEELNDGDCANDGC